jgi:hypothetical protein
VSANGSGLLIIERILRDRQSIWQQIVGERELTPLTLSMLASSAVALACYGAVLGAFHSVLMALTSAVKLPLLFLITLAICLPTLYLFNLVFGAKLSVRQALALVMVAITVTSMLAVAFAPISLFFLITAPDYGFFKLLNVSILTLSAVVGLRFLTGGMEALNEHGLLSRDRPQGAPHTAPGAVQPALAAPAAGAVPAQPAGTPAEATTPAPTPVAVPAATPNGDASTVPAAAPAAAPATAPAVPAVAPAATPVPAAAPGQAQPAVAYPPMTPLPLTNPYGRTVRTVGSAQRPASMTLLYIWILLFGFVGTQLGWTLRPFFGSPGEGFALFRSIDGNFYAEIFRTIASLG